MTYTLTFPSELGANTGKWTFTQNNGSIVSSIIVNEHFFEPFGFFLNSTNVFNGTTLISKTVIKLQSEDRLLIHSNMVNNGRDDILVSINSTTSINFSSINYECPAPEFYGHVLSSQNNNTYSFTLTDENGELIQLNGLNMNITLLFYKKDPIFDQIRNFLKVLSEKKKYILLIIYISMASPQAIAQGDSVVSADQINYQQKMFSHPSYKFEPQFPNTFGQSISLGSSQSPSTINLPPEVFNLAQSYLNYTVTLPAGVAYVWYALQALKEISHIQFYSGSNMWIVDLDNLQNYLDIVIKKELEADEFLSLDSLTGLSNSNSLVNVIPALRNTTQSTTATVANGAANPSSANYAEPAYFQVSANATQVVYNVQFPLRLLKNTAFSIDKNMYFGQTTYLKMYFGPLTKVCYNSDSNANPSAGAKTVYTGAATITNLQLMLAVESNQDLRTMLINKVASGGLSYMIPYVQAFKNSNSGTSQNISIQLDQGNGRSLMKVYHAPYNQQEQLDTMYDHANTGTIAGASDTTVTGAVNQKLTQYYTQLNGKRNQDITIDCTNYSGNGSFLDYMSHRRQLRGSIIRNANIYQYNWFHCDDFSDFGAKYDQDNRGELIAGIPMSVSPLTWSFVGVSFRALLNAFQHYTWFVFVKKLAMAPGVVEVI